MLTRQVERGPQGKAPESRKQYRLRRFSLNVWSTITSVLGSRFSWSIVCLFATTILAYAGRHAMNPDGLSYLDLASAATTGGPGRLISDYWSPVYPALLSVALLLFRPAAEHEVAVVHLVNLVIYIATLGSFSFFLRRYFDLLEYEGAVFGNWKSYFTPFAYCTFLFCLRFVGTDIVTPDLAVAAIVFLASGFGCRLCLPEPNPNHYLALGVVLGIGYYVKVPMLPLGIAFLLLLFLLQPAPNSVNGKKRRLLYLTPFAVALLIAGPMIAALSVRSGRVSFGESGRLNYVWYADGYLWADDAEHPKLNETTDHPAPKLMAVPLTLQFASPILGTYPLWYDPPYWYRNIKARFDLRKQVIALKETLRTLKTLMMAQSLFIVGAVVLIIARLLADKGFVVPRGLWWQLAWPLSAASMYAVVHIEPRFMGPFLVLWWLGVYGALLRAPKKVAMSICVILACLTMISLTAELRRKAENIVKDLHHPSRPDYQILAEGLRNLGLKNGDHLAIVGYAYNCYYAHYDHLRVIAQVTNAREFSRLTPSQLGALVDRLASIGVNALVVPNASAIPDGADWKEIQVSQSQRAEVLLITDTHRILPVH